MVLGWLGFGVIELALVHLPIGISFFTFQALSYVVDVYRGESAVQRSPVKLNSTIFWRPSKNSIHHR